MPTKKPTIASAVEDLQGRVETLDQEIARVRKMRPYDKLEQERINGGIELANRRSAHLETRVGILESASSVLIERMTIFAGFFRTQREDSALHEERISRLETTSNATSYGSIFATWLAVSTTVVVGMLIAHNYLAERYTAFYQGRTIDIGAHPGYDPIFWAAGAIALVATTVAALVAASSGSSNRSSTKTSSSRRAASASTSSTGSIAVAEDYVYVETTPTEVTPVVRV